MILLLRRRRLAALPPEARAFVESRRRARWRTLRDPRNWPELIRANPLVALLGLVAVGVLAVLFLTRPESERQDPFEDFDPEDLQLPTLTPQTTTLGIVLRCADGSTVPLGPGADIAGCEDYTVGVDLPGDPAPSSSVEPDG